MQSLECPFCTHANPPGAKFCVECGAPRHLAPCEQCSAINHVDATQCHRCSAPLQPSHGQGTGKVAQRSDVAEESDSSDLERGAIEHELGLAQEEKQAIHSYQPLAEPINFSDSRSLFSEVAEKPPGRWARFVAGVSGLIVASAIAVGGYLYFRDTLMIDQAALARRNVAVTSVPPEKSAAAPSDQSTTASLPPLAKEATMSLNSGALSGEPTVRTGVDTGSEGESKPISATATGAPAGSGNPKATYAKERIAPPSISNPGEVVPPKVPCPPAVTALGLCEWLMAHTDGK